MKLDEIVITKAIISRFNSKLMDSLESDVAIVGGGPAGLVAAYYLARNNKKVVLFERKLSIGGGMWGGGMMFNEIVIQDDALPILKEFGVKYDEFEKGYYCSDSIEAVTTICSKTVKAGVRMFNCISVEDVMMEDKSVTGLVINWTPVMLTKMHVDPLVVRSKYVVDSTGHDAEIAKYVQNKSGYQLNTSTGKVIGEKPMNADTGERTTVENTKEVFPGLYIAGMSCNAAYGAPRMGPVFGGMLLSGKKVAELLLEKLG